MALAMMEFSYKTETLSNLIKNPEDRSKVFSKLLAQIGGKLHAFYYMYGDYDGVAIIELPDNVALSTTSLTCIAGGGLSKVKTTVLIPVEEAMTAMKNAQGLSLPQPKA